MMRMTIKQRLLPLKMANLRLFPRLRQRPQLFLTSVVISPQLEAIAS